MVTPSDRCEVMAKSFIIPTRLTGTLNPETWQLVKATRSFPRFLVCLAKAVFSNYMKGDSHVNYLFDMKLRSVAIPVTGRGERDRSKRLGEGGCMPSDSEEVSRNTSEHREGLVTRILVVTNPPEWAKSGTAGEVTGESTMRATRGGR